MSKVIESGLRPLPSWFVAGLSAAIVWCVAAGAVGIALLMAGWYNAAIVGALATLAAATAAFFMTRALGPRPHADHRAALAAVGLVVVFFVLAGVFHSEHLLLDRDPGLYIATGRSIARFHELRPKTHVGPFTSSTFGDPNARYQPNFFPMLPVLLAQAWSLGGDRALLLTGPFLGSLGLLAFYALASRVLHPRVGLLAPLFLMLEPLQLWFARDAYSELVVQVVVLGGLWLYLEARERSRWPVALLSGFIVASSGLARIDALAIVVGCLLVVAVDWVRCDSKPVPVRARRVVAAFGAALVAATLLAVVAMYNVAHMYVVSLGGEYRQLLAALAAALVGVAAVVTVHRIRPGIGARIARLRYLFATAVALVAALGVWAYVWRPDPVRDLPVPAPGHPISPAVRESIQNWHYSWSLHWFSSYFGLVGVVAAFVGLAILGWRALRGNGAATTVFLVVVPMSVLYIARPSITADQPWAMRRYLPVVIPGLVLGVVIALQAVWRRALALRGHFARGAAVVGALAAAALVIVPTGAAALPFAQARYQHGAEAAIHGICGTAGDDAAVLIYGYRFLDVELPEALRAFCGMPVAGTSFVDLPLLAREWRTAGRRLIVATAVPDAVRKQVPGAKVIGHYVIGDDKDPERSFERAPRDFDPKVRDIWLLLIPPVAG